MIGVVVKAIGKDNFFDSEMVMKALNDAQRRTLSKFGSYVRTAARSSIKQAVTVNKKEIKAARKSGSKVRIQYRPSKPGEAPRSRRGELKKFLFFGYEPEDKNVVIGPTLVGGRASETPGRLEFGGELRQRGKIIRVQKRPFMKPAFDKQMARMPALFADSLVAI